MDIGDTLGHTSEQAFLHIATMKLWVTLPQMTGAQAHIAALTRQRDQLEQRVKELSNKLMQVSNTDSNNRQANAARQAALQRTATQVQAKLAAAVQRIKDLSEELTEKQAEIKKVCIFPWSSVCLSLSLASMYYTCLLPKQRFRLSSCFVYADATCSVCCHQCPC